MAEDTLARPAIGTVCKTPTTLQHEAVECGAACLAMVLAYYRCFVPLEVLRVACGVNRDGSKASNLLRAARTYGLVAKGYRKEPAGLADLRMPAIIFWNFNHFVVLEGERDGKLHLNDPALGRRAVDAVEFDRSFTGVVLAFEPGPEFKAQGKPPSVIAALRRYFQGMTNAVLMLVVLGLLLVIPGFVFPILSSRFVDDVLVAHNATMLGPLLMGLGATALARAGLDWVQTHFLLRTQNAQAQKLTGRFFWHALCLPAEFYTQRSAGEMASRVDLNERVAEAVSGDLSQALLSLFTASFFLILMFWYDLGLSLIALVAVALELFVWRTIAGKTGEISQQLSVQAGKLAGTLINGLTNIETIKASGQERSLFNKWVGLQVAHVNSATQAQNINLSLGQVPNLLSLLVNISILGLGSLRIMDGAMTIGGLVAFQTLMASFAAPTHTLLSLSQKIQTLRGDLSRLDDVLRYPTAVGDLGEFEMAAGDNAKRQSQTIQTVGQVTSTRQGELELRDLSFGYSRNEAPVIDSLSLHLLPGSRIALVGASGCGKSTVARLVAGLYAPWSGEILFDGAPRAAHSRTELASALAIVDQDIFLFEGSFRENLTMWDTTIADDDIFAAARDACIHDVILDRLEGYSAKLEEGGRNLSGGQRQRLEIARALVRKPRILVLDEATSALDTTTERQVEENLRRRGCTCLIVSHRLSSIRDADEIIVLDRGRVVERGPHIELMKLEGGHYGRLVASEFQ